MLKTVYYIQNDKWQLTNLLNEYTIVLDTKQYRIIQRNTKLNCFCITKNVRTILKTKD